MGGSVGDVFNSIGNAVTDVVNTVDNTVNDFTTHTFNEISNFSSDPIGYTLRAANQAVSQPFNTIKDATNDISNSLGLYDLRNSIANIAPDVSREITNGLEGFNNWAGDLAKETYYTFSGEMSSDERMLSELNKRLDSLKGNIDTQQSAIDHLRFFDEIFKYAHYRDIKNYSDQYNNYAKQYQDILNNYNEKTRATGSGDILSNVIMFFSGIQVVGAIYNDVVNYIKTGDSNYLVNALTIIVIIVGIIYMAYLASTTLGTSAALTWKMTLTLIGELSAVIAGMLQLDSMVNNSGVLGSVFSILDTIINKWLGVGNYIDTRGINKDSDYYQSNMMWVKLTFQIGALLSLINAQPLSTQAAIASDASTLGNMVKLTQAVTSSDIFQVYAFAQNVGDVVTAIQARSKLEDKLNDYQKQLDKKHAQDLQAYEDIMRQDGMYINAQTDMNGMTGTYVTYNNWMQQMTSANVLDYDDPEGNIAYNVNFKPPVKTQYGFENMFSNLAGSPMYSFYGAQGTPKFI